MDPKAHIFPVLLNAASLKLLVASAIGKGDWFRNLLVIALRLHGSSLLLSSAGKVGESMVINAVGNKIEMNACPTRINQMKHLVTSNRELAEPSSVHPSVLYFSPGVG